jgi:pimeloyl-ACP methyl ester carboxylesterase
MSELPPAFKSPLGETRYMAAYEASLRLWTTPYEAMDVRGRFGRTHLVACGPKEAPPLVLLHGFFASLTMWAYNIAELSRDYRVYALDVMGQPSKSIPDQPIGRREDFVEWLTAILDALSISRAHLAGMSYGGWIALNYAIRAPERLQKVILLSPAGSFMPLTPQFYARSMLLPLPPGRFWMSNFMSWMTYPENLRQAPTRQLFNCIVDQMYLGVKYFKMQGGVNPIAFADEELRGVKNPVLLLIGRQEVIYSPTASCERAKRLVPAIRTEVLPKASHDLTFSQAKTVNQRILDFLKE